MKSLILQVVVCALISAFAVLAQQDSTVQWKTTLQDLEHRLTGLPSEGAPVEAWRSDAEGLRADIVSFADDNPGLKLQLPEALPASPDRPALTKQLDALNAVVNQVIQQ